MLLYAPIFLWFEADSIISISICENLVQVHASVRGWHVSVIACCVRFTIVIRQDFVLIFLFEPRIVLKVFLYFRRLEFHCFSLTLLQID